jgi:hypothetical protein
MINYGEGGAGVGSFLLFRQAIGVYLAVQPGAQTIIAMTFPTRGGSRHRQSIPKSLHVHTAAVEGK